jgi:hypothetical protein
MLTDLLRRAVEQAERMSEAQQDRLGQRLLDEMLTMCPEEDVTAEGLLATEQLAAECGADERPLTDVLAEYEEHGRFLGA